MEALSNTDIIINCYKGILDNIKVLRKEIENNKNGMSDETYNQNIRELDEYESECLSEITCSEKTLKKIKNKQLNPKGFKKGGQSW